MPPTRATNIAINRMERLKMLLILTKQSLANANDANNSDSQTRYIFASQKETLIDALNESRDTVDQLDPTLSICSEFNNLSFETNIFLGQFNFKIDSISPINHSKVNEHNMQQNKLHTEYCSPVFKLGGQGIERVGRRMDSCMISGESIPVEGSKSWKGEHQETHSRHSRYMKVQTLRETDFIDNHSPRPTQMDLDLYTTESVSSKNSDSIPLCKNGENLENKIDDRSVGRFLKKINETQLHIDNKRSTHINVQKEKTECVKFTILKRSTCEADVFENSKTDSNISDSAENNLNVNCFISNVEKQNGELSKLDAHGTSQSDIPSDDQTCDLTKEQQNLSLANTENHHLALTNDSSFSLLATEGGNDSEEISCDNNEDEFTSGNRSNDEILILDLKCSLSQKGILDSQLETKVPTGSLELSDKHNSNYRISSNIGSTNNLIEYLITDFHFQFMTVLCDNVCVHDLKPNIDELDDEDILINFGLVKQKLVTKSKLQSINNTAPYHRPIT